MVSTLLSRIGESFGVQCVDVLCRYEAIRLWNKFLTGPDSEYWVQLSPGTAVGTSSLLPTTASIDLLSSSVIDNHRVLHGRSAFTGKRRMCGAYVGVDEYRSKLTVLQEKFAPDAVTRDTATYATVNGRSIWSPGL